MMKGSVVGADSQTIFQGAVLCHNGAGKVAEGADSAGFFIAGVSPRKATTGTSNTKELEYEWGHEELFAHDGSLTAADVGKNAALLDDNTVCDSTVTTNDVVAGRITEFVSSSFVWVHVGVFALTTAT
jgi:hypothetical protein